MDLTNNVRNYLQTTLAMLRGSDRRLFMARTVRLLGLGGQRRAERELGWSRVTIRKGLHELDCGFTFGDNFAARGRLRSEDRLPTLSSDLRDLVDPFSQTDPTFHTQRLYTRLTVAEVRRQLIECKGYCDTELPSAEPIRRQLLRMNYRLRRVAKCRPKKRYRKRMRSSSNLPR